MHRVLLYQGVRLSMAKKEGIIRTNGFLWPLVGSFVIVTDGGLTGFTGFTGFTMVIWLEIRVMQTGIP